MFEISNKRGVLQKRDFCLNLSSSHAMVGTNPNGQRGWDLNPLNPKRRAFLERRAKEAVSEYRHAVDVYKEHQVKKS